MATNWIIPTESGLTSLLDGIVLKPVSGLGRGSKVVAMAVARIRGAISTGNRTPLSLTAGSIPAEAESHCYYLAIWFLVPSTPPLAQYVINPPGSGKSAMMLGIEDAQQYLKDLKAGQPSEYPSDPQLTDASGFAFDSGGGGDIKGEIEL
jgi:hypothetical protein